MFSHYAAAVSTDRKRLRELGFRVGRFPAGERNSLLDVSGVLVGHRTLGDEHTGVTAVLPHGGNLYAEKVAAACHVVNGYGKAAGLSQLEELGTLESPLLITNTLAVGAVWEGALRHVLDQNPEAARDRDTVNPVVAECFDGWLSDARALPVRPEHALEAIAAAGADEPAVGNLGAGAGTTAFGFKAGIGMASRRSESGHVLGCLAVPNFGAARDRHLLLGEEGAAAAGGPPDQGGSVVVVLGTDAPL
jgi:D-aminopeptidase